MLVVSYVQGLNAAKCLKLPNLSCKILGYVVYTTTVNMWILLKLTRYWQGQPEQNSGRSVTAEVFGILAFLHLRDIHLLNLINIKLIATSEVFDLIIR